MLKKLINKHTISLLTNAAMPLIGMVVLSLMAHNLPAAAFGNYIFFLLIFTLADLFRAGFLQNSLIKFYSGAAKERALTILGSIWYAGFILTGTVVLINLLIYLFFPHVNPDMTVTLKWFGIIYFSTLPIAITSWVLQAEERFDKLLWLQMLNQGLFFTEILVLVVSHRLSFQTAIYSYFAANLITSLVTLITGWSKFYTVKHRTTAAIKELAHFGKYSVGTTISASLLRSSDTFIIKLMFRAEQVAVYYIPQRLMEIFEIPMRSFVATAMPELSAAVQRHNNAEVSAIMKRYAGMLTIALLPVAIAAFIAGGLVIQLLFGEKYADSDAVNIFRIFMCYVILMPADRFFGITLDCINKPHQNMIKVLMMLAINIAGDFAGILIFHNLYGVAIASILTFLSGTIFGYLALKKHLNFTFNDVFKVGYAGLLSIVHQLLNKTAKPNKA